MLRSNPEHSGGEILLTKMCRRTVVVTKAYPEFKERPQDFFGTVDQVYT